MRAATMVPTLTRQFESCKMKQQVKVELTLVRNSNNEVTLELVDRASHIRFFETKLTLDQFARLITGMTQHDIPATVRGMENVGKQQIIERRSVVCPDTSARFSREKLEQWLAENVQDEDGWYKSCYLGSRDSIISNNDGTVTLTYKVYKFV